jgi:hypothetical protein
LFNITLTPTLRDEIIAAQNNDEGIDHIMRRMQEGVPKVACFHEDAEGTLWFEERLVVPKKEALKKKILDEAHTSRYSIHPGSTKMYHDLRQNFFGQEWSTRPLAMFLSAIPVGRSRLTMWSLEGYYNHWVFQNGSGMI